MLHMLQDMHMSIDDIVAVMVDCHICNLRALEYLSSENHDDDDESPSPTTFNDLPLYSYLRAQRVEADVSDFSVRLNRKLHLGCLAHAASGRRVPTSFSLATARENSSTVSPASWTAASNMALR
eukprot:PhM_4_TR3090/c4_g4_i2/m.106838